MMVRHVGWENWGKMSCSRRVMTDPGSTGTRIRTTRGQCLTYLQVQSFWQDLTFESTQICLACQTGSLPSEVLFFLNLMKNCIGSLEIHKKNGSFGEIGHEDNVDHWTITILMEQENQAITLRYLGNINKWAMAIIGQEEAMGCRIRC